MSHEHDPKASGLEEIQARRAAFAEKMAAMSIVPCDTDGQPVEQHATIHFPQARRHDRTYDSETAWPGDW